MMVACGCGSQHGLEETELGNAHRFAEGVLQGLLADAPFIQGLAGGRYYKVQKGNIEGDNPFYEYLRFFLKQGSRDVCWSRVRITRKAYPHRPATTPMPLPCPWAVV